jgi:hypothetical protein
MRRLAFLFVYLHFPRASAFNGKTRPEERNAILISWDGALREHVRERSRRGKLPNLARFITRARSWISMSPGTRPTPRRPRADADRV